jgi:type I restriction enzyme S subunit
MGAFVFPKDSIIFAKIGAAIFLERKRILAINSCIDNNVMAFVFHDSNPEARFFHYLFQTIELGKLVEATALPSLNGRNIAALRLAFPKPLEQRAIAVALSDVDELIASLDALIDKKRDIKKAVQHELLTGKTRLPGFDGAWSPVQLGDLATFHKGKGLPKASIDSFGPDPCIHYGELFTRYSETICQIQSYTRRPEASILSKANDVLMPTSDVTPNGLAKSSCITMDDVILGGDILIIRPNAAQLFGSFLSRAIRYDERQVLQLVTGTTVFHLYAGDMQRFEFRMPGLTEQHAIVDILSDIDADIAGLEARRVKTRAIKQGMMQELLTGRIRLV